ncbi:MAG: translation initiation factor IF-2 [Candidatus Ryanbacteria bacterium RIFCSPHIGHO2_01_FULL_45_22]|nr:MAG: translation initiation factor IF-2 [Candidatus Ryanbacteria bacterium RIFCSPHIGHO2_01_FULL_45_22]
MNGETHQGATMITRPPIVVIMGHIDHGKTTLLDFIRSSNVAIGEAGHITQHIGAYEVERNGHRITFLDTPGHELFSRMRERGARVADIAVIVVAADEGVKPQTAEAIRAAKEAGIPFLVALNKIDRPEADANRVKGELAEHDVLVEGWGGNVPIAELSAKTGAGVPELLDLILLASEMEELVASPDSAGSGVVIESHRDRKRGVVATLLIKNGTIRKGDWIQSGAEYATIRVMENSDGNIIESVSFSSPVQVLGFSLPPSVGDAFQIYMGKKQAEEAAKRSIVPAVVSTNVGEPVVQEGGMVVPLIIKADVAGSREALEGEITKVSSGLFVIKVLRSDIGDIADDDVKTASGLPGSIIIGFKVKVSSSAETLAQRYGITIHTANIIYELLDWFRIELERRIPKQRARTEIGALQVLRVFKKEGKSIVFGGKVVRGVVKKDALFEVKHGEEVLGSGTITNVQQSKMDVKEVAAGSECGIAATFSGRMIAGDVIDIFEEDEAQS